MKGRSLNRDSSNITRCLITLNIDYDINKTRKLSLLYRLYQYFNCRIVYAAKSKSETTTQISKLNKR